MPRRRANPRVFILPTRDYLYHFRCFSAVGPLYVGRLQGGLVPPESRLGWNFIGPLHLPRCSHFHGRILSARVRLSPPRESPRDHFSDLYRLHSCGGGLLVVLCGVLAFKHLPTLLASDTMSSEKRSKGTVVGTSSTPLSSGAIPTRGIIFLVYAIAAVVLVFLTDRSLQQNLGLPFLNQALSWAILGTGCALVVSQTETEASTLISNLFLGVGGPYILMSVSYVVDPSTSFFIHLSSHFCRIDLNLCFSASSRCFCLSG
jgi:hypothetical protein